ncbi:hypothetical protein QM480_13670 [Flectobacillus sp. DC10W]|uniref:Type 1 periplasmic binding fold superfamily protein n=1 Tax=Flectobacillus longus TaxID=2984207 RepID=A0ABT6YP60_9BACT|nr:hypothetical protein [Flectobacillus longus]MDI9865384.1 hypothetical protein [Flectobacillus longus]
MKNLRKPLTILALAIAVITVSSCKKDAPDPVQDSENLTTLKLNFTSGGVTKTFAFKDLDGIGGNAPVVDNISLDANKTYSVTVQVLDESKSPAEDITSEIETESFEHLFVYTPTPSNLLTITRTDKDNRNLEVGLKASAVTTNAGTGTLRVVLYHQPPQNGVPIKDGTAKGSTDFDAQFNVTIK